jgi:hypothetical protein
MADTATTPLEMRSCGTCVACCVTPRIATSEISKAANTACDHCTGSGCAIYDARPQVCRDYLCHWRRNAEMDDSWRPDRSGVIVFAIPAPPGYATSMGLELMLTEGEDSIRRPWFAPFVAGYVRQRRAIFMTINDVRALLNPYMERTVLQGDDAVREQLLRFHAGATTHRHSRTLPALQR